MATLPAKVPALGSEVNAGPESGCGVEEIGGLGTAEGPGQTCFDRQVLCIMRVQVSLGQGRHPALSLEGQ